MSLQEELKTLQRDDLVRSVSDVRDLYEPGPSPLVARYPLFRAINFEILNSPGILPPGTASNTALSANVVLSTCIAKVAQTELDFAGEMAKSGDLYVPTRLHDELDAITNSEVMHAAGIAQEYPSWAVSGKEAISYLDEIPALSHFVMKMYMAISCDYTMRDGLALVSGALASIQLLRVASNIHEFGK